MQAEFHRVKVPRGGAGRPGKLEGELDQPTGDTGGTRDTGGFSQETYRVLDIYIYMYIYIYIYIHIKRTQELQSTQRLGP